MSGQSTGRKTQTSVRAARSPATTPAIGARMSEPSSRTGNGSGNASQRFPTAMRSSHASPSTRHALGQRLAAEVGERFRGPEAAARAADEQYAGQAVTRHGSV
jgi:hypothetical protein